MKLGTSLTIAIALCCSLVLASTDDARAADDNQQRATGLRIEDEPPSTDGHQKPAVNKINLKLLTPKELEELLDKRLNGSLGLEFAPFANMFVVRSTMDLGIGVGLTARQADTEKIPLEPAFPSTYKPTFREFLDAIALQTNTRWRYEAEDQFARSSKPRDKEVNGMIVIMFEPHENELPYEIAPAEGWQAHRRTNWIMYVPPIAPVGMDLHVLGRLSAPDKAKQDELFRRAPADAAAEMKTRVKQNASAVDIKEDKVGPYPAQLFETSFQHPAFKQEIHWRQWYFMVDNQLCYVISTIQKDQDDRLYPDVEKMIKTFHKK